MANDEDNYCSFTLDTKTIDTNIVKSIGINRNINSIIVKIDDSLVSSTIHLEAFSEKTIRPLKRDLSALLKEHNDKTPIINSIITCIHQNINLVEISRTQDDDNNIKGDKSSDDKGTEGRNAQTLFDLATQDENIESLFKNQYGKAYAAVRLDDDHHLQVMPVNSSKFRYYLTRLFRKNAGKIIGKDAINNAINAIAANAEFEGETIPLHIRVAWGQKVNRAKMGCIYYDMTDNCGRIIEISKNGWQIMNGSDADVPIVFKRHNQAPQVEPNGNYPPDIFDQFLNITNVTNQVHRHLLKVLIVSAFIPEIDHPILTTYGPQGAAKSFLLTLIKILVDPSKPVLLTLLKDMREFIQQVNHNYLAFYDNVKYIPYWLSDEICKAVTGIGHTKRELYTDDDDIIYEHRRWISINGINVALTEPDALDRSIFIELSDIDDTRRREKEELLAEFEKIRPKLLDYIFDILVKALQIKPTLQLTRLPRMADFAKWGEAISRAMGYDNFAFLEAYAENRNQQNIVAVNENIIGLVFVRFYCDYEVKNQVNPTFVGSPELLYKDITDFAERNQININYHQFPKAPNILIKKLKSLKLNLREGFGINVDIERDSSNNSIVTVYRKKPTTNVSLFLNHYYGAKVQNNHLQNYNYVLQGRTRQNNELTSATSQPPTSIQNSTDSTTTGGTDATEVTSVSCEAEDRAKNEAAKSDNPIKDNSIHHVANDSDREKVDTKGYKN